MALQAASAASSVLGISFTSKWGTSAWAVRLTMFRMKIPVMAMAVSVLPQKFPCRFYGTGQPFGRLEEVHGSAELDLLPARFLHQQFEGELHILEGEPFPSNIPLRFLCEFFKRRAGMKSRLFH
jgi:hypothetical protein